MNILLDELFSKVKKIIPKLLNSLLNLTNVSIKANCHILFMNVLPSLQCNFWSVYLGLINQFKYRRTSLSAVLLSANSLLHTGLKGRIFGQKVSFYLRIQYSRSKIAGRVYHLYFQNEPQHGLRLHKLSRYIEVNYGKELFVVYVWASKNKLDRLRDKKYLLIFNDCFLSNPALQ